MRKTAGSFRGCVSLLVVAMLVPPGLAFGQAVSVRYREGAQHGFVVVRDEKGATIASGEFFQVLHGDSVKSRLILHFRDGSVDDDSTVYSQARGFRLVSDRHIQKGRTFPAPCDVSIDMRTQQVSVLSDDGTIKTERVDLPPDLANGLLFNLVKNVPKNGPKVEVSYLAIASKPRVVKLAISAGKEEQFTIAGHPFKALEWNLKPELGGLTGIVAPMIGKQPPDLHVWVTEGSVPTVVRVDAALYNGGPIWSIRLASPVW